MNADFGLKADLSTDLTPDLYENPRFGGDFRIPLTQCRKTCEQK